MRKVTLLLVLAGLVAFMFAGCTPTTPVIPNIPTQTIVKHVGATRLQGSGERVERIVISPILRDPRNGNLYVKWAPGQGPDQEYVKRGATQEAIIEDIAPIKTQNTFVLTAIRWQAGAKNMKGQTEHHPNDPGKPLGYWVRVPGIKVKWILNSFEDMGLERRVGDIVDWDHSDREPGTMGGWQDYLYNTITTLTNYKTETIKVQYPINNKDWHHRQPDGKPVPTMDGRYVDFEIQKGQTWITLTASRAGQTDITAYAPEILHHLGIEGTKWDKVFITKKWGLGKEFGLEIVLTDDPCDPFDINFLIQSATLIDCTMCNWKDGDRNIRKRAISYKAIITNTSNQDIHGLWLKFVAPRWNKEQAKDDHWLTAKYRNQWKILGWRWRRIDGHDLLAGSPKGPMICVPINQTDQYRREGKKPRHPIDLTLPSALNPRKYDIKTLHKGRSHVLEIFVIPKNPLKRDNTVGLWANFKEWKEGSVGGTSYNVVEKKGSICITKSTLAGQGRGKRFFTEEPTKVSVINVMFTKRVRIERNKVLCKKDKWGACTRNIVDKFFRVDANVGDPVTYIYDVTNTGGSTLKAVVLVERWKDNNIGIMGKRIKVGTLKPGQTKTVKHTVYGTKEGEVFGTAFLIADGMRTVGLCEVPQHLVIGSPAGEDVLTDEFFSALNTAVRPYPEFIVDRDRTNMWARDLEVWLRRIMNINVKRGDTASDPIDIPFFKLHNDRVLYVYTFRNQQTGYINNMNFAFMTSIPATTGKIVDNFIAFKVGRQHPVKGHRVIRKNITNIVTAKALPTKTMFFNAPATKVFPTAGKTAISEEEVRIAKRYKNKNGIVFFDLPNEFSLGADQMFIMFLTVKIDPDNFRPHKYSSYMVVNAASTCGGPQDIDSVAGEPTHLVVDKNRLTE